MFFGSRLHSHLVHFTLHVHICFADSYVLDLLIALYCFALAANEYPQRMFFMEKMRHYYDNINMFGGSIHHENMTI